MWLLFRLGSLTTIATEKVDRMQRGGSIEPAESDAISHII
jgi:hypothetical protein